jgi:hypothetical protein
MPIIRSFVTQDIRVKVDLTGQILCCDVLGNGGQVVLAPTLDPGPLADFVPGGVLLQKAKQFDDGLLASVDGLIQEGAGKLPGRRWLLARWAQLAAVQPRPRGDALEVLLAACRLGGVEAPAVPALDDAVALRLRAFLEAPVLSKPLGFYTWTEGLARTFQQDRMLQTRLDPEESVPLVTALAADPRLAVAYDAHRALAVALTGASVVADLRGTLTGKPRARARPGARGRALPPRRAPSEVAIFPAADSPEQQLVRMLMARRRDPSEESILDELVRRVRAGAIDLAPGPKPGWYREKLASLVSLVLPKQAPEAPRRHTTTAYDEYLEVLFRATYALTRETHIKDLDMYDECEEEETSFGRRAIVVPIAPKVTLDPLPTLYLRRAETYRALREALDEVFGTALARTPRTMASGAPGRPIGVGLVEMEALFRDAAAASWRELGVVPERKVRGWSGDSAAGARRFAAWRRRVAKDQDVTADARMMVPVSHNSQTGAVRVWAFLGWTQRLSATFSFAERPRVTAEPLRGDSVHVVPNYLDLVRPVVEPVVVETYVTRLLDRDSFRRLCDRCKSPAAILEALD